MNILNGKPRNYTKQEVNEQLLQQADAPQQASGLEGLLHCMAKYTRRSATLYGQVHTQVCYTVWPSSRAARKFWKTD